MKTALIVLVSLAVVLGIIAYFAVFSGTQVIEPDASSGSTTPTLILNGSSTATSSAIADNSSSTVGLSLSTSPQFQTNFSAPYPATWTEGQTQFAITSAMLQDNQLTLVLNVQLGDTAECVPINLRLVTDEEGDVEAPNAPAGQNFPLDGSADCDGTPNTAYPNQTLTFTVSASSTPFLFTTGGQSNIYFEVTTTTNNGINVQVPQSSG